MRARILGVAALLAAASCSGGTYVTLTLEAGGAALSNVARIDLDLQLAGKNASATLTGKGGNISFPTTTVLDVASGDGTMMITANAIDAGGNIVAQTIGTAMVQKGKSTTATLSFGASGGVDMAGNDLGPCGVCDPKATCSVAGDAVTCACPAGFTGDGHTCTDVDECAAGTAGCDANATCTNIPGSFTCSCKAGYSGTGFVCTQVWVNIADIANKDLDRYGNVVGFGNRIFLGNENSGNLQHWTSIDTTMSNPPPTAEIVMPPPSPSQNDWCVCGGCSAAAKMTQIPGTSRFYAWCFNLEYFDATARTWTAAAPLPQAQQRTDAGSGAIGNKLYWVGGRDSSTGNVLQTVQTLDFTSSLTMPVVATLPATMNYPIVIQNPASAVFNGKLYVWGGSTIVGSQTVNTRKMHVFDPTSGWTALPDAPYDTTFYIPYTAVYNNKLWAFDAGGALHSYDPSSNVWDAGPKVSAPGGYSTNGRGWLPVVAGMTTQSLFAVNYQTNGAMVKISVFKYNLP